MTIHQASVNAPTDPNIVTAPANENFFTIERSFDAPRALVYRCYTEPRHMVHFWGPRDTTLVECKIDLCVGGVWRVRWQHADGRSWGYSSVYLAIVPEQHIDYRDAPDGWSFGLDGLPPIELNSTIALAESNGRTIVTVTVRCRSVAARDDNVKRGFTGMVSIGNDRLAEYLTTLDPAQP
jgi:uncharacterized protein YndB with AHSA1/START domain